MELTGNLKKQVESESTREGRKDAIRKAGMLLTDEELDKVAGGQDPRIIRDCNSCPAKYERNCEGCPAYHG